MQKVITVLTSNTMGTGKAERFIEISYPALDKALEDGYIVKEALQATHTQGYTLLTFILEKAD